MAFFTLKPSNDQRVSSKLSKDVCQFCGLSFKSKLACQEQGKKKRELFFTLLAFGFEQNKVKDEEYSKIL